eukprot:jgi/Undpi1/12467/HiC_scaffold_5.g02138.m1
MGKQSLGKGRDAHRQGVDLSVSVPRTRSQSRAARAQARDAVGRSQGVDPGSSGGSTRGSPTKPTDKTVAGVESRKGGSPLVGSAAANDERVEGAVVLKSVSNEDGRAGGEAAAVLGPSNTEDGRVGEAVVEMDLVVEGSGRQAPGETDVNGSGFGRELCGIEDVGLGVAGVGVGAEIEVEVEGRGCWAPEERETSGSGFVRERFGDGGVGLGGVRAGANVGWGRGGAGEGGSGGGGGGGSGSGDKRRCGGGGGGMGTGVDGAVAAARLERKNWRDKLRDEAKSKDKERRRTRARLMKAVLDPTTPNGRGLGSIATAAPSLPPGPAATGSPQTAQPPFPTIDPATRAITNVEVFDLTADSFDDEDSDHSSGSGHLSGSPQAAVVVKQKSVPRVVRGGEGVLSGLGYRAAGCEATAAAAAAVAAARAAVALLPKSLPWENGGDAIAGIARDPPLNFSEEILGVIKGGEAPRGWGGKSSGARDRIGGYGPQMDRVIDSLVSLGRTTAATTTSSTNVTTVKEVVVAAVVRTEASAATGRR